MVGGEPVAVEFRVYYDQSKAYREVSVPVDAMEVLEDGRRLVAVEYEDDEQWLEWRVLRKPPPGFPPQDYEQQPWKRVARQVHDDGRPYGVFSLLLTIATLAPPSD